MKSDGTGFLSQIAFVVLGAALLIGLPLIIFDHRAIVAAGGVGCLIGAANAATGALCATWAFGKPQSAFLKILFGGMGVRMGLIGIAFLLLVKYSDLHVSALTLSLFGFYVLFQILEVRFLTRHLGTRTSTEEA